MNRIVVDALGEQCPIPVVKAVRVLRDMTGPGVLEIHVDNDTAVQNLKRMASGYKLKTQSQKKAEKHFIVTVTVDHLPETLEDVQTVCTPTTGAPVVAVDTDCMGRGNDELGKILIKGFLYALSQMPELPQTILFYNGGAKLTTEGSDSLEDLKNMEEQGVEILTCGTCLNFYGLSDKLKVGSISNMYTIVEKLSGASKVIKP